MLARIETSTTAPFGMDFPETSDVFSNTKNNNKIVWKNVTVVDQIPGPRMRTSVLLRNTFDKPLPMSLRAAETQTEAGPFFRQGHIFIDLKPQLFERWRQSGAGREIKATEEKTGRIEILSSGAMIRSIKVNPNETIPVNIEFAISKDYSPRAGSPAQIDLIQLGAPGNPDKIVGGQRFTIDLSRLVLVNSDAQWRYRDSGLNPGEAWTSLDYDDSKWNLGAAPFGSADNRATTLDIGPAGRDYITTYFRHEFDVADPSFYRSALLRLMSADAAIVYLNGREIHRTNLPPGAVNRDTPAERKLTKLEGEALFPVKIDPAVLKEGKNVIAAEIHLNSPQCDELRFGLELLANKVRRFPSALRHRNRNGKIERVEFWVKDIATFVSPSIRVATVSAPPYSASIKDLKPGHYMLWAIAVNDRGGSTQSIPTHIMIEVRK